MVLNEACFMKENTCIFKRAKYKRNAAENITSSNFVDDLALLTITTDHSKSLLHSLEQATKGIGLNIDSDKTEFRSFNYHDVTALLSDKTMK